MVEKTVEKKGDYRIGLQKNQRTLYKQVSELLLGRKVLIPCFEPLDKGNGREMHEFSDLCLAPPAVGSALD